MERWESSIMMDVEDSSIKVVDAVESDELFRLDLSV